MSEIGAKVRERRVKLGMSQEELARAAGTSQATIDKIEHGRSNRSRFLPAVFSALSLPMDDLAPTSGERTAAVSAPIIHRADLVSGRDLPVYASAEGGAGQIIIHTDVVDWVRRPSPLEHVREGYGLIITGFSMEPLYRQGDVALVHPHLPPRQEDAVIAYNAARDLATLKEYRGATELEWRLRRYQPEVEDFTLDRKKWPTLHTVVGKYSRR